MIAIAKWNEKFENADTRKRERLGWYLAPSGNDSKGYRELMRKGAHGLLCLGVFSAMCQLMATLPKAHRGRLMNSDGTPMELEDIMELCRMTGMEAADFRQITGTLLEVGWLVDFQPNPPSKKATAENDPKIPAEVFPNSEINGGSASDLPPACQSPATNILDLLKEKEKEKEKFKKETASPKSSAQSAEPASEFDRFWSAYPKKTGKQAARNAWKSSAKRRPAFAAIMAKLEAFKQSDQWTREDGRFIPNPATWINQGRWDDEIKVQTQAKPYDVRNPF